MPGARDPRGGFVTNRVLYRANIVGVDTLGADDPTIPILDTRDVLVGPHNSEHNNHGGDARIFAAVLMCNVLEAHIGIWMKAETDPAGSSSQTVSSSSSVTECSDWVMVSETVITTSYLIRELNIPPGQYKIIVSYMDGNGSIEIRTQYAG